MSTKKIARTLGVMGVVASMGLIAACSSGEGTTEESTAPEATGVLSGICEPTIVIQADWEPESEHGGIYELLGDDYVIDTAAKSVTGSLVAGGEPTGVNIEIRIGGSPVSYQAVQSLLYQDQDIFMGYGRVSEMMVAMDELPVTAVLSTLEKSPYSVYWDPETYPDAEVIADLKEDDVTILMGSEATVWQDYLIAQGIINESQVDQSDAPKPGTFIAAGGEVAEAGFASAEPFMYEVEAAEWQRPVKLQLIHDTGYPEYFQAMIVRSEDVTEKADCLEALVPIMQQAQADYAAAPDATNALIVELVEEYNTGWIYTAEQADWALEQQLELGLIANGADGTLGSFETERVQELIDIVSEYTNYDVSEITPDLLVTNEFLDPSIALD